MDYDVDAYCYRLAEITKRKQDLNDALRYKLASFKNALMKEEGAKRSQVIDLIESFWVGLNVCETCMNQLRFLSTSATLQACCTSS